MKGSSPDGRGFLIKEEIFIVHKKYLYFSQKESILFLIFYSHLHEEDHHGSKYVFVTGGVVSGLGKGITARSLSAGFESPRIYGDYAEFDPYINIDPGTMNPVQHGRSIRNR